MSYYVFKHNKDYGPRKGLEGPFHYPNGQVLYYDPKAGEYYDPTTDFYVSNEDVAELQQQIFNVLAKQFDNYSVLSYNVFSVNKKELNMGCEKCKKWHWKHNPCDPGKRK